MPYKTLRNLSKSVAGTVYTGRSMVEDMGVNHTGLLGPVAVMARAEGFPESIEEFGFQEILSIGRQGTACPPWRED